MSAATLAALLDKIAAGTISGKIAKEVFEAALDAAKAASTRSSRSAASCRSPTPRASTSSSPTSSPRIPTQVEQFRAGKQQVLGFLVGQVMKASRGKANPQQVNDVLRRELGAGCMNEVQTFVLEDSGIRGALVRLKETWQQVIAAHDYPPEVRTLLGEGVVGDGAARERPQGDAERVAAAARRRRRSSCC